jgi:hypothetical protein
MPVPASKRVRVAESADADGHHAKTAAENQGKKDAESSDSLGKAAKLIRHFNALLNEASGNEGGRTRGAIAALAECFGTRVSEALNSDGELKLLEKARTSEIQIID